MADPAGAAPDERCRRGTGDRFGRHLDEVAEALALAQGWWSAAVVLKNLTGEGLDVVAARITHGQWAAAGRPPCPCVDRPRGTPEDAPALGLPSALAPHSTAVAVAQNARWSPWGPSGHFVVTDGVTDACFAFSAQAGPWQRAAVGAAASPRGTLSPAAWAQRVAAGGVPVSPAGAGPVPCGARLALWCYVSLGGELTCVVDVPSAPRATPPAGGQPSGSARDTQLYELLGVTPRSSAAEIERGYRIAAMREHPDKNPGDPAAEGRFKAVARAHEVLTDPQRRRQYDLLGPASLSQSSQGGDSLRAAAQALFGHRAFCSVVGDLELLQQLQNPCACFGQGARDDAAWRRENARVLQLAAQLDARLQGFVDNERRWEQELEAEMAATAAAAPGACGIGAEIAAAYCQTARQGRSRACGAQAFCERRRECAGGLGRDLSRFGRLLSAHSLKQWAQREQTALAELSELAERARSRPHTVSAAELRRFAGQLGPLREPAEGGAAPNAPQAVSELLGLAADCVDTGDMGGAAAQLDAAHELQRESFEAEFRRRMEEQSLAHLFAEGRNEVDHIVRRTAKLAVKGVLGQREDQSYRRSPQQGWRMLHALELLGAAYEELGRSGAADGLYRRS